MANLFYRNTNAKISFDVLDENNNLVGLSTEAVSYYYIKTPDNYIISNDPNIALYSFANGIGSYVTIPAIQQDILPGQYYINYVLNKVGEWKYKFQVNDTISLINLAISGDIKVIGDGIF